MSLDQLLDRYDRGRLSRRELLKRPSSALCLLETPRLAPTVRR
jgi:hypothetical protein